LEKIEMKKTLVAVAAVAAVTGAMADVTIYGTVDEHVVSTKTTKTTTSMSGAYSGNALGFKGSEDLSGGMKANFQVEFNPNWHGASSTQTVTNYQSFAGLSGDLGSLRAGQFFSQQFFNNALGDATGRSNAGGFTAVSEGATGVNQNNNIEYTLPSIVSGLGIIVARTFDSGAYDTTTNDGSYTVSSSTYRLTYSTGALNVGYATSKANTATAGAMSSKSTSTSANYDLGVAKLFANYQTYLTTTTATNMGISIPFGAAALNANYGYKSVSGTKTYGYILQGTYAFSKRTTGIIQYAPTGSAAGATTTTTTTVGVQHTF